jgi:hypothetical protein
MTKAAKTSVGTLPLYGQDSGGNGHVSCNSKRNFMMREVIRYRTTNNTIENKTSIIPTFFKSTVIIIPTLVTAYLNHFVIEFLVEKTIEIIEKIEQKSI